MAVSLARSLGAEDRSGALTSAAGQIAKLAPNESLKRAQCPLNYFQPVGVDAGKPDRPRS